MSEVSISPILPPAAALPSKPRTDDPRKIAEAAQQFEALLIGQVLETMSNSGGWLGSGEDATASCVTGLAQEQLASMMAKQGGFGLAKLIATGLERGH